jgi:hypothetical protein
MNFFKKRKDFCDFVEKISSEQMGAISRNLQHSNKRVAEEQRPQ